MNPHNDLMTTIIVYIILAGTGVILIGMVSAILYVNFQALQFLVDHLAAPPVVDPANRYAPPPSSLNMEEP